VVGNEGNDLLVGGPGLSPREAPKDKLLGGDGNDEGRCINTDFQLFRLPLCTSLG
jgi:hypothetical protein